MKLALHDPGRVALRRAARTAIVMPPLFALCLVVLDDQQAALFASFGSFAMFAFADFGGPPPRRARAYLGLTAVGAALLTVGTLVSDSAWLAALVMAVVGFVVTFAGSLGGYFAAGGLAAILSFVLAVAVPVDAAEIPSRLAGWGLAGAACTLAALLLWPRRGRNAIRQRCAETAKAIAALLDAMTGPEPPAVVRDQAAAAEASSTALGRVYNETPFRPAGPTIHDQALAYLTASLRRGQEFAGRLVGGAPPPLGPDAELVAASAVAFHRVGGFLEGGVEPDLSTLEEARASHARAVEAEFTGTEGPLVVSAIRRAFDVRVVSFAASSAEANALLALGAPLPEIHPEIPPLVPAEGLGSTAKRLRAIVRSHLRADSVWFRASVRAALGLAVAVLVAILAQLQHAFWVVLGTLTVLKSSAVTTGFTAWQAMLGTLAGFGLSTAFLEAGGSARPALWVALPICVFLAVYTPTAIHAVVGQALFTVTVVVLFNLIQPQGWGTGLIRVEDIFIGATTSLVVGIALWPRGARGQLREALGVLLAAGGDYVKEAIENALEGRSELAVTAARAELRARIGRATEAFATFLNERGPKKLPIETWLRILSAGHYLRFVGDGVVARTRALGPVRGSTGDKDLLEAAAADLDRRLVRTGDALAGGSGNGSSEASRERSQLAARVLGDVAGEPADGSVSLVWMAEWIDDVQEVLDTLEEPLAQARTVGARAWWK